MNGGPVEPSFLLEVMAMQLITGSWTGSHPYELREFFASAADRVDKAWPDPAYVGPDISDVLDEDGGKMRAARLALSATEAACTQASMLERRGRNSEAVTGWRALFGELFPAP